MASFYPGKQEPTKYGHTGSNYAHWGEQEYAGFSYNPETDKYYADPEAKARWEIEAKKRVEEATGTAPEKTPGIYESAAAATLPIAATAGATGLAGYLARPGATAAEKLAEELAKEKLAALAATRAPVVAVPASPAGASAAASGLASAGEVIGTAPLIDYPAGTTTADLFSGAAGETSMLGAAAPYLGAAGAGLGAYGIYNATQMHDKKQAALAGGLSGAGMGMGTGLLALGAANMWNPVGWGLIGGGALLGAGLGGLLAHKSTKQYEQERWGDAISKSAAPDSIKNAYALNHPEGDTGVFVGGPHAGERWSFEAIKDMGKDDPLGNFDLVLGHYQTYGDEWDKIPLDRRAEIIRRNLAMDNYESSKGDVLIKDAATAQRIKDEVMAAKDIPPLTAAPSTEPTTPTTPAAVAPNAATIPTPVPKPLLTEPPTASGGLLDLATPTPASGSALPGGGFTRSGSMFKPDAWESAVSSGRFRPGSAGAGGYVDVKTGKWFPYTSPVPG
jgi:hypothetical protein